MQFRATFAGIRISPGPRTTFEGAGMAVLMAAPLLASLMVSPMAVRVLLSAAGSRRMIARLGSDCA